ncbi:MAG: NAD(P)(+) transhydrogenase (Re/Si-specific) subunit alpha, partial [Deltaproteobacteria bacterium]|nr:NAD(P)(+) transhydrogenase (Re/Si-specific) subunit alpha [Deltaproteobacteria bacterium]
MLIGIPKEILSEEKRVAATPETVLKYIKMGFDVAVESSAGEGVWRSDEEYENSGASIISDTEKLFAQSDVILKVKQPVFNKTV